MKKINEQEFKDLAKKKYNVDMTIEEVKLILGYVEGHGYEITVYNNNYDDLQLMDIEDEYLEEEETNIKEIVENVLKWNVELYEEYSFVPSERKHYEKLREDEKILDKIWARFK